MEYNYVQTTPFSNREKIRERFWEFVNATFFRYSPWFARKYRRRLLILFGASVAPTASVHQTASIRYPWRLSLGNYSSIGEGAYVSCLAYVEINDYAIIGQFAKVETGSHDIRDSTFSLKVNGVRVGTGAWVCMGAFVLPGVSIGARAVVGAGAVCRDSLDEDDIVLGNPAFVVGKRSLR